MRMRSLFQRKHCSFTLVVALIGLVADCRAADLLALSTRQTQRAGDFAHDILYQRLQIHSAGVRHRRLLDCDQNEEDCGDTDDETIVPAVGISAGFGAVGISAAAVYVYYKKKKREEDRLQQQHNSQGSLPPEAFTAISLQAIRRASMAGSIASHAIMEDLQTRNVELENGGVVCADFIQPEVKLAQAAQGRDQPAKKRKEVAQDVIHPTPGDSADEASLAKTPRHQFVFIDDSVAPSETVSGTASQDEQEADSSGQQTPVVLVEGLDSDAHLILIEQDGERKMIYLEAEGGNVHKGKRVSFVESAKSTLRPPSKERKTRSSKSGRRPTQ